jgi:hypothetical protein
MLLLLLMLLLVLLLLEADASAVRVLSACKCKSHVMSLVLHSLCVGKLPGHACWWSYKMIILSTG